MNVTRQRHDEVVSKLRREYEAKGFTTEVATDIGDGLKADLLVKSDTEIILIEVKTVTSSEATQSLPAYAELAQRNGWRFVIVVADSKFIDEIEVPPVATILAKLTEAKALTLGSDASVLTAWAALEGAARLILVRFHGRIYRSLTPQSLAQQLATLGLLTIDEERELLSFIATRNRLAHGLWNAPSQHTDVAFVFNLTERLLSNLTTQ